VSPGRGVAPPTHPRVRQRPGSPYDSHRHVVVLFAGSNGSTRYNDVWEYDGVDWTQAATPPTAPVVRDRAAVAFDPVRARTLVFGGRGPTNTANLADTWEWDGASWLQRGAPAQPPARSADALAFDGARAVTLLFGGQGTSARLQDTWEWDGAQWLQRLPAATPPARSGHALAFDSARQRA